MPVPESGQLQIFYVWRMTLNFAEFRGDSFSIDGRKVKTFDDCKEWIAIRFNYRGWDGLLLHIIDRHTIKLFEDLACDLYSFLLSRGEIK